MWTKHGKTYIFNYSYIWCNLDVEDVTALAKEKGFKVENQGDLGLSMRTNDLSVNFMKKGSAVVVGPDNEEEAITLFKSLLGTKSISV